MNEDSKSGDTSEVISSFGSPTNYLNNSNNKLSSIVSSRRQSIIQYFHFIFYFKLKIKYYHNDINKYFNMIIVYYKINT